MEIGVITKSAQLIEHFISCSVEHWLIQGGGVLWTPPFRSNFFYFFAVFGKKDGAYPLGLVLLHKNVTILFIAGLTILGNF